MNYFLSVHRQHQKKYLSPSKKTFSHQKITEMASLSFKVIAQYITKMLSVIGRYELFFLFSLDVMNSETDWNYNSKKTDFNGKFIKGYYFILKGIIQKGNNTKVF